MTLDEIPEQLRHLGVAEYTLELTEVSGGCLLPQFRNAVHDIAKWLPLGKSGGCRGKGVGLGHGYPRRWVAVVHPFTKGFWYPPA